MSEWSLSQLLAGLHDDIEQRLSIARKSFSHPGTKGNASEHVWLELLQNYLPQRYQAATAHVVDSLGQFSDQIDVVIFDRQYSPFIFKFEGQVIVPAESVYGVFEAKQVIDAEQVKYAQDKAESVRKLDENKFTDPACGRDISAKASTVYPRRTDDIRKRLESADGPAVVKLAYFGTRIAARSRLRCCAWSFRIRRGRELQSAAKGKARHGVSTGADRSAAKQRYRADD